MRTSRRPVEPVFRSIFRSGLLVAALVAAPPAAAVLRAAEAPVLPPGHPDASNVVWTTPGEDPSGSMPIGNGDIGLNVWVEKGGDILFYISKTDAWSENGRLLKLGRVRVSFAGLSRREGDSFRQELRLREGAIEIRLGDGARLAASRIWVDANAPVVRIETECAEPRDISVKLEVWRVAERPLEGPEVFSCWHMQGFETSGLPIRLTVTPDTILEEPRDRIVWYHRGERSVWPIGMKLQGLESVMGSLEDPLLGRTFGGAIAGEGFVREGRLGLRSKEPRRRHAVSIHIFSGQTSTAMEWLDRLDAQIRRAPALEEARPAHEAWWRDFWARSWIRVTRAPVSFQTIDKNDLPLRLGADSSGGTRFKGHFLRARLFSRTLSPEEIGKLAGDPGAEITEGLVGDWQLARLEGGMVKNAAKNIAGNTAAGAGRSGLDARVVGKVEVTEHGGRKAARLAGEGYFEVARDPLLDLDAGLTLEAWIAPEAHGPEGARIIDKSAVGTSNGYLLDTYPGNSLRLITRPGSLVHDANLPPGRWCHVAATVDGRSGARTLYLSGSAVASSGGPAEEPAAAITRAYALQRWVTACAGRGGSPIKFNGSIFTVEPKYVNGTPFDPDYRAWGGDYWWQNTRLPYWPLPTSGDVDLMLPVFEMYFGQLDLARHRTRLWHGARGAWFGETVSFWGMYSNGDYGWKREGKKAGQMDNPYIRHIWQVGLELTMMMLDAYDHSLDEAFLQARVLPVAKDVLLYFDTRFPRDGAGKILIRPGQACETWQDATNPLPEVAGLHVVLGRLLALPERLLDPALRSEWSEMRGRLPDVPMGSEGGKSFVLPGQTFTALGNIENPELYAVFPYRLFGAGRPRLDVGLATFERRRIRDFHGWQQNAIQAACLGLSREALSMLVQNATRKHEGSRFPAFWGPNYDWVPDQCHGGNLMSTIQHMLLQHDGRRILLLPAWPRDWDVEFKLHAPLRTTVEGTFRSGKLEGLRVAPEERAADVVVLEPTDASN